MVKYFILAAVFFFNTSSIQGAEYDNNALRKLHFEVFDTYFPDSKILTSLEKKQRNAYRQKTWVSLQNTPVLKSLLASFPLGVSVQEHLNSLLHSEDKDAQKLAFMIRKFYLSLCYDNQISLPLAKVKTSTRLIAKSKLTFPKSQLYVKNGVLLHEQGNIDYLIVGSGPAGSVVASELRRKYPHRHIVLVDAGSFVDPQTSKTALDADLIESNNLRTTTSGGIILRNGWAVGGGATVNIDLAFSPLLPQVLEVLTSWQNKNYMPKRFFHHSENDWKTISEAYDWVTKSIGTRDVLMQEININNKLLMRATQTAQTYDLNQLKKAKNGILKISSIERFILPALKANKEKRGSLSLLPNAKITKLSFSQTESGVRVVTGGFIEIQQPLYRKDSLVDINKLGLTPGAKLTIKAKNIILSAGTLGSSSILLRSNVKNKNIGRGIVIHPSMGIVGEFDHEINAHTGLSASVYATSQPKKDGYYFESMGDVPSFIALIHPGTGEQILHAVKNFKNLGGFGVMLIDTPDNNNRVFIDSVTHKMEVEYTLSFQDKDRLRKALKSGVAMLFKQGAKSVFIPSYEVAKNGGNPVFTNVNEAEKEIDKLTFIENMNFVTSAHMQGSNKMGISSENSVISNNFKVWSSRKNREIDNLYVVDSSIFPTSIGANPMQSIYTFAKIFVDNINSDSM